MKHDSPAKGRRWVCQADHDMDDARYAQVGGRFHPRDPNGWPGGIPAEAFDADDAQRALELAGEMVQIVQARMIGVENP